MCYNFINASVAELVDASDSKSDAAHTVCRFESGLRHHKINKRPHSPRSFLLCNLLSALIITDGAIISGFWLK